VDKIRLAVVSPFLDKQNGTERIVIEWLSNLPPTFEIHIYSQRVEDIDPSKYVFHQIPRLPGPHLFNFLWWLIANRLWRIWDQLVRGIRHDIVYSPGANCLDADAISIHIIFAEYICKMSSKLKLLGNPIASWPRNLHRRIYYRVAMMMERAAYTNTQTTLVLYAKKTATELERHYGRLGPFPVLYLGIDHSVFNRNRRLALRGTARHALNLEPAIFTVLLIGNDWLNKGLFVLLNAIAKLHEPSIHVLAVGREDPAPYEGLVRESGLDGRVHFLPPRSDVELYYAAADIFAGTSLEDTFALPSEEAMACGLPVIVSSTNGTSEIITDGEDGLILVDPTDTDTLAAMIRRLYADANFRNRLGTSAAETAERYTWERNGRDLAEIFRAIIQRKAKPSRESIAQEL